MVMVALDERSNLLRQLAVGSPLGLTVLAGVLGMAAWGRTVMDDAGTLDPVRPALACAAAVAAVVNGYCRPDTDITVHLIGGALKIRVGTDLSVQMTGPCTKVYEGEYDYEVQDQ